MKYCHLRLQVSSRLLRKATNHRSQSKDIGGLRSPSPGRIDKVAVHGKLVIWFVAIKGIACQIWSAVLHSTEAQSVCMHGSQIILHKGHCQGRRFSQYVTHIHNHNK